MTWYYDWLGDNLESGRAESWYEQVVDDGAARLEESHFWQTLQKSLSMWNTNFQLGHSGYPLFEVAQQPSHIYKKSFQSVLNKSFRWNVLDNNNWPKPPEKAPSTTTYWEDDDPRDPMMWYGPHNWLADFPDIFRARLTTDYFDGVPYLVRQIEEVAKRTTPTGSKTRLQASLEGHYAAHIWVYHELDMNDYDYRDPDTVDVRLELQITTTIQSTISKMLHRVYEDWRVNGRPPDWEWDLHNPAFSVNYLGSALHYLEGMIVVARDNVEAN